MNNLISTSDTKSFGPQARARAFNLATQGQIHHAIEQSLTCSWGLRDLESFFTHCAVHSVSNALADAIEANPDFLKLPLHRASLFKIALRLATRCYPLACQEALGAAILFGGKEPTCETVSTCAHYLMDFGPESALRSLMTHFPLITPKNTKRALQRRAIRDELASSNEPDLISSYPYPQSWNETHERSLKVATLIELYPPLQTYSAFEYACVMGIQHMSVQGLGTSTSYNDSKFPNWFGHHCVMNFQPFMKAFFTGLLKKNDPIVYEKCQTMLKNSPELHFLLASWENIELSNSIHSSPSLRPHSKSSL